MKVISVSGYWPRKKTMNNTHQLHELPITSSEGKEVWSASFLSKSSGMKVNVPNSESCHRFCIRSLPSTQLQDCFTLHSRLSDTVKNIIQVFYTLSDGIKHDAKALVKDLCSCIMKNITII